MSQEHEEDRNLTELLKELVPELNGSSNLLRLPTIRFHSPDEVLDNGNQCYISAAKSGEMRDNYIWMPEQRRSKRPAGYYHLRTREANMEIYFRLQKVCPGLPDLEL